MQTTIIHPMFGVDIEHLLLLFLDCTFAKQCWQYTGLHFEVTRVESAFIWLLERLTEADKEVSVKLDSVLWGIWSARNIKVWDQKNITPDFAMQWSSKQITQWREMKMLVSGGLHGRQPGQIQGLPSWSAPNAGHIKLNVDASVYAGDSSFSLGTILRDHMGTFVQAKNLRRACEISVFEVEAWGVLEALKWINELQLSNIYIEFNSILTVNAIKRGTENYLEVGSVLQECRSLLRFHQDIIVSFVKKQTNKVAHLLARCLVW